MPLEQELAYTMMAFRKKDNYFGRFLNRRRREIARSQTKLAEMLGVDQSFVSKWESGKRIPPMSYIRPMARALKMTDKALRRELAKAEIREVLYRYGFNELNDGDVYGVKIFKRKVRDE